VPKVGAGAEQVFEGGACHDWGRVRAAARRWLGLAPPSAPLATPASARPWSGSLPGAPEAEAPASSSGGVWDEAASGEATGEAA
jgi:hypothetical protein